MSMRGKITVLLIALLVLNACASRAPNDSSLAAESFAATHICTIAASKPQPVAVTPRLVPASTAFDQAARLQNGINIYRWFARRETEDDDHYQNYVSDAELKALRAAGFDSIRLPIGPAFILPDRVGMALDEKDLQQLDAALQRLLGHGFSVVVDYHDKNRRALESDVGYQNRVTHMWCQLATHLAKYDPHQVMLELLNEPRFIHNPEVWYEFQRRLHAVVRRQAPSHTIIATSHKYSAVDTLPTMQPLADSNVIYTIHFYRPVEFTNQGQVNIKRLPPDLAGLPYPATPVACQAYLQQDLTAPVRALAEAYCAAGWDKAKLQALVAGAAAWGKQHNVPIWVGEFGVRRANAPVADRLRWFADMRAVFAEVNMPWALWSYDDSYGLEVKTGRRDKDVAAIQALGLEDNAASAK